MRPARLKTKALAIFLAGSAAHAELNSSDFVAIDQYISERKKTQANAAPLVDKSGAEALAKLGEMEKKIFPITVWVDGQVAQMIAEEAAMERRSKALKEQEKFNPYDDPVWKRIHARISCNCAAISNSTRAGSSKSSIGWRRVTRLLFLQTKDGRPLPRRHSKMQIPVNRNSIGAGARKARGRADSKADQARAAAKAAAAGRAEDGAAAVDGVPEPCIFPP
jgi:hypothetical protein